MLSVREGLYLDNEYLQEKWMTKRDPVREPEPKEPTRREPPPITPPLKDPPTDIPPQEDPDGDDSPMKVGAATHKFIALPQSSIAVG